jgi:catechol-2,3-dioxygenase
MTVSRLAHVALDVPDLASAEEFYAAIFGLATIERGDGAVFMSSGRSRTYELALREGAARMDHFALAVTGEDGLAEALRILVAEGVATSPAEAGPGIARAVEFALPTGHAVHLAVEADPVAFVVNAAAPRAHHRGVGPVPIEHVTLHAYDIKSNVELLRKLGMRLSESIQPPDMPRWSNSFLRAGTLHHDVGMIVNPEDTVGLHHFCFEVPSYGDLVSLADAVAAWGIELDASIGRHVSGNNVFLYFKDPWGNRLEVNTDMARVDLAAPPLIRDAPAPFDAWRPGRPPAMTAGSPARDARVRATAA